MKLRRWKSRALRAEQHVAKMHDKRLRVEVVEVGRVLDVSLEHLETVADMANIRRSPGNAGELTEMLFVPGGVVAIYFDNARVL